MNVRFFFSFICIGKKGIGNKVIEALCHFKQVEMLLRKSIFQAISRLCSVYLGGNSEVIQCLNSVTSFP